MKKILIAFLFIFSLSNISYSDTNTKSNNKEVKVVMKEFTLEELAKYDGKEGRKAYIAVDGIVYDVSDSKRWKNGNHNGFSAGKDLSEFIKKSPHGKKVLERLKKVGTLKVVKKK